MNSLPPFLPQEYYSPWSLMQTTWFQKFYQRLSRILKLSMVMEVQEPSSKCTLAKVLLSNLWSTELMRSMKKITFTTTHWSKVMLWQTSLRRYLMKLSLRLHQKEVTLPKWLVITLPLRMLQFLKRKSRLGKKKAIEIYKAVEAYLL